MSVKRQTITAETECKICGAPAIYQYFGVISCQPCKVFFRRNANLRQVNQIHNFLFFDIFSSYLGNI